MRYNQSIHAVGYLPFPGKETFAAGILTLAIFFNAALAILNSHVASLSQSHVLIAEATITGLALLVIAFNFTSNMVIWAFLLALLLLLHSMLALVNQSLNLKFIRDVIDIPIFIALGMVYSRSNFVRLFFYIQCIVFLGLLLELLAVDKYSSVFNVLSYYVNTRDFVVQDFWNTDSSLFISATRPNERFLLGFLDIHRFSSTFLEPVSLGNYSIVTTIFIFSFWKEMAQWMRLFFVLSTLIILVGSDGRLATVTCVVIALGSLIFPRLPRYSNVLYLPALILILGTMIALLGMQDSGDDFTGRLAGSIDLLTSLNIEELLGFDAFQAVRAFDSGITYFIITQSIIGAGLIWLFVCLVPRYDSRTSTVMIHSICLYISFNLLVSYSLFSIKTAALMWFMYGYILQDSRLRRLNFNRLMHPQGRPLDRREPAPLLDS